MFIRIDDRTIINVEQARVIETSENAEVAFVYMSGDSEKYYTLIGDQAKSVWDYFNSIAMTPGEGKEQPEQMSRREAELLIDYGDHKSSCMHWNHESAPYDCDCEYPQFLEQAQSILEQLS